MPFKLSPLAGFRAALVAVGVATLTPEPALAVKVTECSKIAICYCVNGELKALVEARVAHFREILASQRKAGKAVGYMSVPLSTIGGGVFSVNMEVAANARAHIEKRFGADQVWILNPGVPEANIPNGSGADYMLMWTAILEGKDGLGEDFDFVYFVGPQDFARYFGLDGAADMLKIEQYFDKRSKTDAELQKAVEKGLTRTAKVSIYPRRHLKSMTSGGRHFRGKLVQRLR